MMMPGRKFDGGSEYRYGFNGQEKSNEIYNGGNSYDFDERIYDGRIGRWYKIDIATKESPSWTPYRFGFNNPLRFSDHNGAFEIDEATAAAYPKLNAYLKLISTIYQNKPEEFRRNFRQYSKMSDAEIAKTLEYKLVKNGTPIRTNQAIPRIEVKSLTNANGVTSAIIQTTNGIPTKIKNTGSIEIDKAVVDFFEKNYNPKDNTIMGDLKSETHVLSAAAELLLESTILHEDTHYGHNLAGVPEDQINNVPANNDRGKQFERAVYGEDIDKTNTVEYVNKNDYKRAKTADATAKSMNSAGKDNLGGGRQ